MSRKKFGDLLQKYLEGKCTPEEKEFIEHWYGLLEKEEATGEASDAELENRLWNRIQAGMSPAEPGEQTTVIRLPAARYGWVAAAASVLLIAGWFLTRQPGPEAVTTLPRAVVAGQDWLEQTNATAKPMRIRLEDGSTVDLAARSSLRYPRHFSAAQRTVYLSGDAFFSVRKMPSRPFLVHAGSVITKVLGTSFYVRSQEATRQVRVEVVTGRVAVYQPRKDRKETNGVVLTPNQTATFFPQEALFVTGLVEAPRVIRPAEGDQKPVAFRFSDAPLSEVLGQLEQAYGIRFEVEDEKQYHCPLTADLSNLPLYTQLDLICAALKADYEVQGTTILLTGKGCPD